MFKNGIKPVQFRPSGIDAAHRRQYASSERNGIKSAFICKISAYFFCRLPITVFTDYRFSFTFSTLQRLFLAGVFPLAKAKA